MTTIAELNLMGREEFVGVCGGWFEHSPWVAERGWELRPFSSREDLLGKMLGVVRDAGVQAKLALIREHPDLADLAGRLAKEGRLTEESNGEQRAAGLGNLNEEEVGLFERYNGEYRERFGFPFVICARENKKEAILAAFPVRLKNSAEAEIGTALLEIGKIARLRMMDVVLEG